ncbi:hypothetical protein VF14_27050 [Nostoc linckia z18]|uniref:LamG domain-containing protein n=2 Tax=Nostoc linckia TaxID=92942 RepID=A0A9Q5Z691_NOSLI|nr:laminin G domain-containing protein [Nostoc linckia]PHK29732.1 hypothetical protein VF12_30595 [Nostoc linckia z15]PHK42202.1 hypothetical protein VF13_30090 [Nostoc linckia z16]PHJ59442.1 hypothetical protein VF02_24860 [Nostoc linckia z1]PHJ62643.1 hypothetical protein VF05_26070 [Nostoc linckia z3]PHJ68795.1 hypothetical protein VF03_24340 [Nostoc linckia z2]
MKFDQYPELTELTDNDLFLVWDKETGTLRRIKSSTAKTYAAPATTPVKTYSQLVLEDQNWSYLRFNETSGTAATDESGNTRNGNYQGGCILGVSGAFSDSKAVTFNGTTGYVSFGTSIPSPSLFCLECLFKTSSTGGSLFGFSSNQLTGGGSFDKQLYLSAGKLTAMVYSSSNQVITSPLAYNNNQWHIVTFNCLGGASQLWVDGSMVASMVHGFPSLYTGYWHIGYSVTGGYFSGSIDEPSILINASLPSQQIKARHKAFLG